MSPRPSVIYAKHRSAVLMPESRSAPDPRTNPEDRDHTHHFAGLPSPRSICAVTFLVTSLIAAAPVVAQQQTVHTGTLCAERRPISQSRDFVGRAEAIGRASVQARVTGYLEGILFTEGDFGQI
jgi:hypothetical protein